MHRYQVISSFLTIFPSRFFSLGEISLELTADASTHWNLSQLLFVLWSLSDFLSFEIDFSPTLVAWSLRWWSVSTYVGRVFLRSNRDAPRVSIVVWTRTLMKLGENEHLTTRAQHLKPSRGSISHERSICIVAETSISHRLSCLSHPHSRVRVSFTCFTFFP